jgi:hypothetical protein
MDTSSEALEAKQRQVREHNHSVDRLAYLRARKDALLDDLEAICEELDLLAASIALPL